MVEMIGLGGPFAGPIVWNYQNCPIPNTFSVSDIVVFYGSPKRAVSHNVYCNAQVLILFDEDVLISNNGLFQGVFVGEILSL